MDTERLKSLSLDHPPEGNLVADQRRKPKRGVALLLALVLAAIVTVLLWLKPAAPRERTESVANASAEIETPTAPPEATGTFTAAGYLEPIPPFPVTVSTLVAGRVDEFDALEGEPVKAGDVLASLNSDLMEQRIAELEANLAINAAKLAQAEKALVRAEKLAAIGSLPKKELEHAQAEVAIARAEQAHSQVAITRAKWQLESTKVRAPVDGVVFERLAQVGEYVSPEAREKEGAAIATLFDPTKIQAWVDVNQRDAHRLAVGQSAEISLDAEPGATYSARVIRILPRASLQKNTVQAKVAIENPSPNLRPDMSAKVTFFPENYQKSSLSKE